MPVVVTGASGYVGRALVSHLSERGGQVRAYVRRREVVDPLRALGAKVAVGSLLDAGTLATVMSDAHTVCHLAGGLALGSDAAYEEANLATTRAVLDAAEEAELRRVLFLSYPGADPGSGNAYLRTKGMAEQAVRASGREHVILRSTHVYGPGSRWLDEMRRAVSGRLATVLGTGRQRLAPVYISDVVAVLAGADDRDRVVSGTWGVQGPDEVTADDLADLLAGRPKRKAHVGPGMARLAGRLTGRRYSAAMLEILAADSLADAPDASSEFGVRATPLGDGLRSSGVPVPG